MQKSLTIKAKKLSFTERKRAFEGGRILQLQMVRTNKPIGRQKTEVCCDNRCIERLSEKFKIFLSRRQLHRVQHYNGLLGVILDVPNKISISIADIL